MFGVGEGVFLEGTSQLTASSLQAFLKFRVKLTVFFFFMIQLSHKFATFVCSFWPDLLCWQPLLQISVLTSQCSVLCTLVFKKNTHTRTLRRTNALSMTLANQLEVRGKVIQATIYFASEKLNMCKWLVKVNIVSKISIFSFCLPTAPPCQ